MGSLFAKDSDTCSDTDSNGGPSEMDDMEVFSKTLYMECRGEPEKGMESVAWVIKNRANDPRWPSTIKEVCLEPEQFECWDDGKKDVKILEETPYEKIKSICEKVYDAPMSDDPTKGCCYYNNPSKEGMPDWTNNVTLHHQVGEHNFYKD